MPHKTTTVALPPESREVEIDNEIVPLIVALNELGWWTELSCQNNQGRIWVSFLGSLHCEEFLFACAQHPKLRRAVVNTTSHEYDKSPNRWVVQGRWWIDAYPYFGVIEAGDGSRIIDFCVINISIRFPKSHLPYVMEVLDSRK